MPLAQFESNPLLTPLPEMVEVTANPGEDCSAENSAPPPEPTGKSVGVRPPCHDKNTHRQCIASVLLTSAPLVDVYGMSEALPL
jgi:hypothetical protein